MPATDFHSPQTYVIKARCRARSALRRDRKAPFNRQPCDVRILLYWFKFANVDSDDLKLNETDRQKAMNYGRNTAREYSGKCFSDSGLVSAYGFYKYFRAKLKNDAHILNVYQQLYKQGAPYGIHCIPLQDVNANVDLCPHKYDKKQREDMALIIYQKLQDKDCVSIGYSKVRHVI